MITREQLEKQLGLDKYTKQQIDEQLAILKAEREHFSKEIDNIRQLLEKKQDTELSVKQETENLRKELGKLDFRIENTTEILVSYYNVLNVLIESENDKISIIVKIMIRLNVLLFIIMIVLFFMLGLNLKLIF